MPREGGWLRRLLRGDAAVQDEPERALGLMLEAGREAGDVADSGRPEKGSVAQSLSDLDIDHNLAAERQGPANPALRSMVAEVEQRARLNRARYIALRVEMEVTGRGTPPSEKHLRANRNTLILRALSVLRNLCNRYPERVLDAVWTLHGLLDRLEASNYDTEPWRFTGRGLRMGRLPSQPRLNPLDPFLDALLGVQVAWLVLFAAHYDTKPRNIEILRDVLESVVNTALDAHPSIERALPT